MNNHPRAGQPAKQSDLINVARLISQYYSLHPELGKNIHKIRFGTSGYRGSAEHYNFNEAHILAIGQAISEKRINFGIKGCCYVGKDTHALSEPAFISILEVLTANGIEVITQQNNNYTPTPVISNAILRHNRRFKNQADGIIITSSHNPPKYGGIKYNTSNGGPANTAVTRTIEERANVILENNLREVKRLPIDKAWQSGYIHTEDLVTLYVEGLNSVVDILAVQRSGLKLGVDPLGGSSITCWQRIAEYYNLDLTVINETIDQTFRFIHLDYDGSIRIDCSSELAMTGLINVRNQFDLLFANDPDCDRHGIVISDGLMKPNHYLAVAINYLFKHRTQWNKKISIGKTLVSSAIIDRVAESLGRRILEVPVGFKWFADGLASGALGFSGEESAGASFLCFNCQPWSTDKDGIIMCLLAAEILAVTGKNPQQHYNELIKCFGNFSYNRIQIPATLEQKTMLYKLTPEQVVTNELAGDKITARLTTTLDNNICFGGIKIITKKGWFAIRPSGTEEAYKIYCESLVSDEHCRQIEKEAIEIVRRALSSIK